MFGTVIKRYGIVQLIRAIQASRLDDIKVLYADTLELVKESAHLRPHLGVRCDTGGYNNKERCKLVHRCAILVWDIVGLKLLPYVLRQPVSTGVQFFNRHHFFHRRPI